MRKRENHAHTLVYSLDGSGIKRENGSMIMKRKEKDGLKVHVIDSSRLINHIVVSLLNIL
jgi:hypothetical protein